MTITPVDDTAYLIARRPGSDPQLKPLVTSGGLNERTPIANIPPAITYYLTVIPALSR